MVLAIAQQTAPRNEIVDAYVMRLAGRVRGLALTHDLIADDDWRGVTLDDLAARQLAPFFGEEGFTRAVCEGPRVLLSPRAATEHGACLA